MKKIVFTLCVVCLASLAMAQTQDRIYDEKIDAMAQIRTAVAQAKAEGKYVCCQVGGDWCPWCRRFAAFVKADTAINALVQENFVYIHVNYSRDNKNPEAMKFLGNPGRFGFPVIVIVNSDGQPIHIQNSAYLEEGQGYDPKKVLEFFQAWTPTAVTTLR